MIFWNNCGGIFNALLKICCFKVLACLWRYCDVIHRVFVLSFGMYGKKRPIAILRYQFDVSGGFNFQVLPPPGKLCHRKRPKTGLSTCYLCLKFTGGNSSEVNSWYLQSQPSGHLQWGLLIFCNWFDFLLLLRKYFSTSLVGQGEKEFCDGLCPTGCIM